MVGRTTAQRVRGAIAMVTLSAAAVSPSVAEAQGGPGFLFKEPRASLRIETGYALNFGNSDVFDQTKDKLTVSQKDFFAPYFGADFAFRPAERWDVGVGAGFSKSSKRSETREFVDNLGNPIEQTTTLRLVPVALSARYFLSDRGRSVGRFAWVPTSFSTYVGAGVGFISYRFEQVGDFVDEEDPNLPVFYDAFVSDGRSLLLRGLVGATYALGGQGELFGEARYTHARADMSLDFDDFDPIDLGGVQAVIGIGIRF